MPSQRASWGNWAAVQGPRELSKDSNALFSSSEYSFPNRYPCKNGWSSIRRDRLETQSLPEFGERIRFKLRRAKLPQKSDFPVCRRGHPFGIPTINCLQIINVAGLVQRLGDVGLLACRDE